MMELNDYIKLCEEAGIYFCTTSVKQAKEAMLQTTESPYEANMDAPFVLDGNYVRLHKIKEYKDKDGTVLKYFKDENILILKSCIYNMDYNDDQKAIAKRLSDIIIKVDLKQL